jgi:hypothetical protein
MLLQRLDVIVRELLLEHREEAPEALGVEVGRLLIGDPPQPLEDLHMQRQQLHRSAQDRVGIVGAPHRARLALALKRLDRQLVHLSDDFGMREAVGEHSLAVENRVGIAQARQDRALGHREQELVAGRHRVPERPQL